MSSFNILLLGSNGFIGSNLNRYFENKYNVIVAGISTSDVELDMKISQADIIIHSIGVSRTSDENDFFSINIDFSFRIYSILCKYHNKKVIYFSSIHFNRDDLYGFTKRYNEYIFTREELISKNKIFIVRTPGIFGPGAKPNFVSVVSTFCFNNVNKIKSKIIEPNKVLELLYIDDLILVIESLFNKSNNIEFINPVSFKISVAELHNIIEGININSMVEFDNIYNSVFLKNIITTFKSFKNA